MSENRPKSKKLWLLSALTFLKLVPILDSETLVGFNPVENEPDGAYSKKN